MTTKTAEIAGNMDISRRAALQGMAGLVVAVALPAGRAFAQGAPAAPPLVAEAYVRVAPDSTVTILSRNLEMGQGPYTGFATLVAEEMDADWSQMRAEGAPAAAVYTNPAFGMQGTGGSTSMTSTYDDMRRAGAVVRAMLVAAAAQEWGVPAGEITIENGVMRHPSGQEGSFGDFAEAASRLTPPDPASVTLKDPSQFRLVGHDHAVHRIDSPAKSRGEPVFTLDIDEPEMLTVVLARPPRFGAKVASFDASEAMAIRGVVDVKALPSGVAVYANGTWPAIAGSRAVKVEWDESAVEARSTAQLFEEYRELAQTPGIPVNSHGDVESAMADADHVVEASYEFPYLAHAPMEPLNGFIHWQGDSVVARFGCQMPTTDRQTISQVLGVPHENVTVEVIQAGGSFGRRGQFLNSFAEELAEAAKAIGPGRPIKVQWTREDDIRGGNYRPMMVHRMRGAVKDGRVTAFADTVVGQSIVKGTMFEAMLAPHGYDEMSVEGVSELPYDIANFACDAHNPDVGVSVLFWRSVGHSHSAFAKESFIDELLSAAGADPVEGRLAMLPEDSKEARTLRAVADMADWSGADAGPGRSRGVAVVSSFNTTVAQIAEVVEENGAVRVRKVWCAVDCGLAINPDVVRAQMEGGIGFGLGHALYGEISLNEGRVQQANFDAYRSLRIREMPEVEVHVMPSAEHPTGVGEPGVPPVGPAVANAIAASGRARPRQLPMLGPSA